MLLSTGILFVCTACSDKDYVEVPVYAVQGKLTAKGEPAYGAYISLHPTEDVGLKKGNKPFARVEKDGTFQLTTYDSNDGAPAGNFVATVYWPQDPEARGFSPDRLKGKYSKPETSKLRVTIEPGTNQLQAWDLER